MKNLTMKNLTFLITLLLTVLLSMNTASALLVNSVSVDTFIPGQEGLVKIEIENSLDVDALEVSLVLNFNVLTCCRKGGVSAKLCTGATIAVPLHIKEGMLVTVNILSESYQARVQ